VIAASACRSLGVELLVMAAAVLTWTATIQVRTGPIPDPPSRGVAIRAVRSRWPA
jgi:uncharacterized protein YraI